MTQELKKFEVGKVYTGRFITNYDSIFAYRVVKRTEKTVWIANARATRADVRARRIRIWDGVEQCDPCGQYSMAPILSAEDFANPGEYDTRIEA